MKENVFGQNNRSRMVQSGAVPLGFPLCYVLILNTRLHFTLMGEDSDIRTPSEGEERR